MTKPPLAGTFHIHVPRAIVVTTAAVYSRRFRLEILFSNCCAFWRISSSDMTSPFTCCACHISLASASADLSGIASSFVKAPRKQVLDSMNLGGHVPRRNGCDLSNRSSVHPFEV